MILGVGKERQAKETRVAIIPDDIKKLKKKGIDVIIEAGAGELSSYIDEAYVQAGAKVETNLSDIYNKSDVIAQVNRPADDTVSLLNKDTVLVSQIQALYHPEEVAKLAKTGATVMAMELVPRITRAQKMDVLSSMANLAGYKAVILAAENLKKLMPMLMTAAGTIKPSKVLILGAGVAGLQAIATAKRLGAIVEAFDTRPVVREQVQSLGGKFVEVPLTEAEQKEAEDSGGYARQMTPEYLERQAKLIHEHVKKSDIVITTAQIFGRKAPTLITKPMIESMAPGSVIIDLAVETGGNTEGVVPNEVTEISGVSVVGTVNLPATVPYHASQMYSRNILEFVTNICDDDGKLNIDPEDEINTSSMVCQNGEVTHEGVKAKLEMS
ncbi:MAG: NAD(P)(+) transhydrogenase (Re/Si-specific) subunit alpha [Zetaproteobacteria bacterium]|nr:NAD(P)(+) transhydrogenase (Re/Si-specific) subunit alpha [Pseudobdellovibrionaceae bacterium]|tara:strand:+ start:347 stop:1495 length:1149 start_codon:yes stop_codon:yes gene_type:complete